MYIDHTLFGNSGLSGEERFLAETTIFVGTIAMTSAPFPVISSPSQGSPVALVLGAAGGVGGAVARTLLAHGWRVRALTRHPETAARSVGLDRVEWVAGDAMAAAEVAAAAAGARLLFHGVNPPRYRNWRGLAIPMLANAIAAAKAAGARLVFPGNVYNFGPDAGAVIDEHTPQHPLTRKGAIRVEMEAMLREAARDGLRSLIVRAGDYFGGHAPGSWFQNAMVKPGRPLRAITYPGVPEVGHSWAYLPDLGEAVARLAAIEARLAAFDCIHFEGHWLPHGIAMAEAVRRAAGDPTLPIRRFPWPLLPLAAPLVPMLREVLEMRYLWQRPLRLDNRKLVALIGPEPRTPLDDAVRRSLEELRCLAAPP